MKKGMQNWLQVSDLNRLLKSYKAACIRAGKNLSERESDYIWGFFNRVSASAASREQGDKLRGAIFDLARLLDPCQCSAFCEHNTWHGAQSCNIGKNPKRCPKSKAYWTKKRADHAECTGCQFQKGRNPCHLFAWPAEYEGPRCVVKKNADRPENCPKMKKEAAPEPDYEERDPYDEKAG